MASRERVVLFDGVCNLCNASVQFVIDHDPKGVVSFAPIQSEVGEAILTEALGAAEAKALRAGATGNGDPDSIVFVENGKATMRSTAALRVARHLRFPWNAIAALWLVPRPIRDWGYRFIARHRYAWFGKSDTCRVPTPELRARFLA